MIYRKVFSWASQKLTARLFCIVSSSNNFASSGKLCDASARYEKAIQEEPEEIGHHKVRIMYF